VGRNSATEPNRGVTVDPPPGSPTKPRPVLSAEKVAVHFAGVKALDGVDLNLQRDEVLGLIGPNGAGKTTLVNTLTGLQPITAGRTLLRGRDVTNWTPERLARDGVTRSFQAARLFGGLTVFENVIVGGLAVGYSRSEAAERAWELLDTMGLKNAASLLAQGIAHGQRKTLSIIRALAIDPEFLLLDEPAAGLNEKETSELIDVLREITKRYHLGLLVIEHDMTLIMRLCERLQVLDHGKTIAIGTPDEVRSDPAVVRAYLGSARGDLNADS
jgi:ABC-type branched-subunit amino acid transport system ATPase component